jgi:hypothetical protein
MIVSRARRTKRPVIAVLAVGGLLLCAGIGLASLPRRGEAKDAPKEPLVLGAASNFSQGWNARTLGAAVAISATRFRDGIRWSEAERSPGAYTFDTSRTAYMAQLGQRGARLTLTVNWGNPLYDGGKTPHSGKALAAFGRFVAEVVARYPAVDTIEVGNEFNGANFVSGPVKAAGLAERRWYHLAMVRSAEQGAKSVRADVKVLGGATHSLPAGYLWPLLDGGGAALFDGLAVHPYTTPIDQLAAQIGVLRRHRAARTMPLHVTEFGSRDPDRAGDDLVRAYAAMASLGVREMDWYPLNERGDGHVPLLRRDLSLTSAGKAFRFVQERLAGHPAQDLSPDAFTFIHAFGPRTWVLWGAPRAVTIDARSVTAFDATGVRLAPGSLALAEDRALILVGTGPLRSGDAVSLSCSPLIADSFYQFTYPGGAGPNADGFERFVRMAGQERRFTTLPGQERRNVPWTPYLGLSEAPRLRLQADTMLPAPGAKHDSIVHRYTSARASTLTLQARFAPSRQGADGIAVQLTQNGAVLFSQASKKPIVINQRVGLRAGDRLSLAVSANGPARGGLTDYRIRLFDHSRCARPAR